VWDGEFRRAGFDETDVVFGSGARRHGASVTFVSSGSTVDRLHSHETAGTAWVANSLVCLLVAVGADVDPTYAAYYEISSRSATPGALHAQRRHLGGPVRLRYAAKSPKCGSAGLVARAGAAVHTSCGST